MLQDIWTAIDEQRLEEAEQLLRKSPELLASRAGQMALGYIFAHSERPDEARQVFGNLRTQHEGEEWEHIAVHQLGRVERLAGQHEAALKYYAQERKLIRQFFGDDDPHKSAANAYESSVSLLALGRLEDTRQMLEEALTLAREADDPETVGRVQRGLGELCIHEGDPKTARLHFEEAIAAFTESEDEFAVEEVRQRMNRMH